MLREDLGAGLLALGHRADGHHDTGAGTGKPPGGFLARTAVGPGDDGEPAALIRDDVHGDSSAAF
jgi:hypothetical protein